MPPAPEAKKPEPPPTTGERLSKLEDLVKDLKLLPFVKDWEWSGYMATSYNYNRRRTAEGA